jgi:peptidase MA superfamily protein
MATPARVRVATIGAFVAVAVAALAPGAAAADPGVDFGTPSAEAKYGASIRFVQPVQLAAAPKRVEVLLDFPGSEGPLVVDRTSDARSSGSLQLEDTLDVADQHLLPNTVVGAHWRVVSTDGTTTIGPSVSVTYADDQFDWQTQAGAIVRIHWYRGDAAFGRRALEVAEQGVAKAEQLFGVKETKPIDFFVYADQTAFYDALGPGTRENVGGEAVTEIRTLFALITPAEVNASWVGIVIPHELTHLVFDTAVRNPYHFPPRWLNEGIAVYLSQGYGSDDRGQVTEAARDGALMPLTGLTGQFPTTAERFSLAYAESVSSVDFFVRRYGRDSLAKLVRTYAGGLTDDEAFSQTIGVDVRGFEAAWLADAGAAPPKRFGPQPAPAGPVPGDWRGGASGAPAAAVGSAGASAGGAGSENPALGAPAPAGSAAGSGGSSSGDAAVGSGAFVPLTVLAAVVVGVGGLLVLRGRRRTSRGASSTPAGPWVAPPVPPAEGSAASVWQREPGGYTAEDDGAALPAAGPVSPESAAPDAVSPESPPSASDPSGSSPAESPTTDSPPGPATPE